MNEQPIALRQRRDLGKIIESAFNLYRQNFGALFGIAAVAIPLGIASGVLQASVDDSVTIVTILLLVTLLQVAVGVLVWAALLAALGEIDAGRLPEFSRVYDVAFARYWALVAALLRALFHVLLFYVSILGIPWAIQRSVRWFFTPQAVILDSTSARAALSYSADAVQGSWWRTFGIAIVIGIIGAIPISIITGLFTLAPPLIASSVAATMNAVLLPFYLTAMTLLYFDLKARKESDVAVSSA